MMRVAHPNAKPTRRAGTSQRSTVIGACPLMMVATANTSWMSHLPAQLALNQMSPALHRSPSGHHDTGPLALLELLRARAGWRNGAQLSWLNMTHNTGRSSVPGAPGSITCTAVVKYERPP